jgi:hypothetical protein
VGHAERAGHRGVVAELVGSSFLRLGLSKSTIDRGASRFFGKTYLQPTGGPRLHDMPHVLDQLTDACSDFSSSYADHHAFGLAVERFSAPIRGAIAGTYMRAFLYSAAGHVWNCCRKWVVGCKMCGVVELEA